MGKKVKTGKSRQDKFYKLAKETGYRSRAAFKLIQLNRKFGFLQNGRVCVDLCAAPGGWMQVAHKNMPLSSLIIGVDLVPIKQVGTCVTFAEDIKSEKCRQLIKKELKTWEVDVFLHDGAPNVGKNWIFDAYQQNELTLFALKLATEFMRKGAWFVTKVFRSKDYHALMWLFKKLFKKVFATKPQASRHESAEIFIVCEGFLKPDKIDPRLLDPKHIFKEMEKEADSTWEKGNQVSQLFKVIEKEKKKPVGYEDGETIIFKKVSVKDYLANETFAELLANYNEIDIDDEECMNHEATTEEVKACCKDLRVLGRKELKLLITWRKKLIKHFEDKNKAQGEGGEGAGEEGMAMDVTEDGDDDEEEKEDGEEDELEKAIKATAETEKKEEKKKKKKEAKKKQKLRERIAMKMVHVGDKFDETRDDEMFDLKRISMGSKGLKQVVGDDEKDAGKTAGEVEMPEVEDSEDSEDDEPLPMKKKLVSFEKTDDDDEDANALQEQKNLGYMGDKIANETVDSDEEEMSDDMDHDSDVDVSDDGDDDDDDDDEVDDADEANPLIQTLTGDKNKEERLKRKTSVWFAKDVFNDVDDDDDDFEALRVQEERRKKKKKVESAPSAAAVNGKLGSDGEEKKENEDDESDSDSDSDSDDSEDEKIKKKIIAEEGEKRRGAGNDDFEEVPASSSTSAKGDDSTSKSAKMTKAQMLDPEGLAIASYLIQSRKHRREIEEAGFNRWVNNDKHLPDWFVKDQKAHWRNRAPVQITKEMVEEYKKRQMEINARPIKKVAEAKARKKKKALKQLEKVKKKAEAVVEKEGMGEKEKAMEIRKMYKKALNRKKTETKLVVSKKGGKGVKGSKPAKGTKYKVVDARLKKDKRASEKKNGKKGGGGGGKKGKAGGGGKRPNKAGGAKGGRPGKR